MNPVAEHIFAGGTFAALLLWAFAVGRKRGAREAWQEMVRARALYGDKLFTDRQLPS